MLETLSEIHSCISLIEEGAIHSRNNAKLLRISQESRG